MIPSVCLSKGVNHEYEYLSKSETGTRRDSRGMSSGQSNPIQSNPDPEGLTLSPTLNGGGDDYP